MKTFKIYVSLFLLFLISACSLEDVTDFLNSNSKNTSLTDYFAVANRGSGIVTIYNAKNTDKIDDIVLDGTNAAPTYVTYSKSRDVMYVADFNNPRVVAYNMADFSKIEEFSVGSGAFHMWNNDYTNQLWVNNLTDKTTSVVDLNSGETVATLNLPEGIGLPSDAVQHDVILSPTGKYAYVSIISTASDNYVLQYDTTSFNVLNATIVGGDPHLTVTAQHLYILSQNASSIVEYNFDDLTPTGKSGSIANAHGVTLGDDDDILVTNISERKLAVYNTDTERVDRVTDAGSTTGVAHNIAFNTRQNILALTLSGGTAVDFFRVSKNKITYLSSNESGTNPFGIVYMAR